MLASRRAALGSAPSSSKKKIDLKVLFVSRRDTCRGPMAETIFEHLNERYSFKPFARFDYRVQSCGLKLPHSQGHLPEQLTLRVLAENGLETLHGCRQVKKLLSDDLDFYSKFEIFLIDSSLWFLQIRLHFVHGTLTVSYHKKNDCSWIGVWSPR